MGRQPEKKVKEFPIPSSTKKPIEVELFTWEKLNRVEDIKREFGPYFTRC